MSKKAPLHEFPFITRRIANGSTNPTRSKESVLFSSSHYTIIMFKKASRHEFLFIVIIIIIIDKHTPNISAIKAKDIEREGLGRLDFITCRLATNANARHIVAIKLQTQCITFVQSLQCVQEGSMTCIISSFLPPRS